MLKNTIIIYRIIKIINHWEGKFYKQDYYVGMRFEQMLEGNCLEKENNDLFLLLRIRLLKKYTHASFLKARLVLDRKSRGRMEWPVHIRSRTSCRNSSVGTPPRSDLPPPQEGVCIVNRIRVGKRHPPPLLPADSPEGVVCLHPLTSTIDQGVVGGQGGRGQITLGPFLVVDPGDGEVGFALAVAAPRKTNNKQTSAGMRPREK